MKTEIEFRDPFFTSTVKFIFHNQLQFQQASHL